MSQSPKSKLYRSPSRGRTADSAAGKRRISSGRTHFSRAKVNIHYIMHVCLFFLFCLLVCRRIYPLHIFHSSHKLMLTIHI